MESMSYHNLSASRTAETAGDCAEMPAMDAQGLALDIPMGGAPGPMTPTPTPQSRGCLADRGIPSPAGTASQGHFSLAGLPEIPSVGRLAATRIDDRG